MDDASRGFYSKLAAASSAVALAGGWLFWQWETGAWLLAAGLAALAIAVVIDHTIVGLGWAMAAIVVGCAPVWLTLVYFALS